MADVLPGPQRKEDPPIRDGLQLKGKMGRKQGKMGWD